MLFSSKLRNILSISLILITICFPLLITGQDSTDIIWPKDIKTKNYTITIYAPENASYLDNKLSSNLAFAVKKEGEDPKFGMMWTTSILDVDRSNRQASLASVKIDEIRLQENVSEDQKKQLEQLINSEIPKWNIEFPLDDLLNSLEAVSVYTSELNNTPPKILFANEPTVLILIDGDPKLKAAEKGFEIVENTDALIIKDLSANNFYLKGDNFWYRSKSAIGPWENTKSVPSKVENIAKKANAENNEDKSTGEDSYKGEAPKIKIVTEPSELIVFEGEPKFNPIQNTNLLYVSNTESDIFMNISNQTYYVLLSGRWFTTVDLKGDWSYIESEKLPEDFRAIPGDSKKANVLSNVAGTAEAKAAIYDAQIPQTAAVKRDTKATTVIYNGTPEFKNIEGLKLEYAVNTESDVFKDKNDYYLLDNAVWFKSNSPNGPWVVADDRPNEIDKIPADNPKYNTKYVYIYETSPTVVYVGYTPGYYGCYVYGPTVVYGTGFYYYPWYGGHYYHHHYSYGFSVRYNPWYGWSVGFHFGSPYGWYGHAYWGFGYHHYGPPYYRPPYYGRNNYVRPSNPIYNGRRGITNYNRPVTRPNNTIGNRPSTRPSTGVTRPSTGVTRPSNLPNKQPSTRPATRPTTQPAVRPRVQPTKRPTNSIPNTRPYTRPSQPINRTTPRPTSRPTAMPSRSMGRSSRGNFRRN